MNNDLPFDPTATPAEVASVLRRVRRRRTARLTGTCTLVVVSALTVGGLLGGSPGDRLVQNDDLVPLQSGTPSSWPGGPSTPAQVGEVVGSAAAAVRSAEPLSPRRTPSPRPSDQFSPALAPRPAPSRPVYAGQLGPSYTPYAATDCTLDDRSATAPVLRDGYCLDVVNQGTSTSWTPYVRVCRLYESGTAGRVTFAGGEEADFALYRGRADADGRPVPGELLFRFADTVRYSQGAHGRDVSPGDCWYWTLQLPVDWEAYPSDAGFVGEWVSRAEQFPQHQSRQQLYFTAGYFHDR